ncbi:MAG: hypothetical protein NVV66_18320 [Cellulomonas sp.]|uniref:hypothetical protein n=1 Tax=Cellulomonas sp. TaxID=40001 RepID=UPI00258266AE|nr:hypothetical protein [Cellulomonas sp.]MCR6706553.1 hypothetical protein [Cellulomonas sp.]
MPDGFTVDTSSLRRLMADLSRAASQAVDVVEPVLEHGALNIKNGLVEDAEASTHFKGMAGALSYDRVGFASRIGFEIGPDKDRRGGALGNIAYFGTPRGGGTLDLDGPLTAEEPRLVASLAKALEGLL